MPITREQVTVKYVIDQRGGQVDFEQRDRFPDQPWSFVLQKVTVTERWDGRGKRYNDDVLVVEDLGTLDGDQLAALIASAAEKLSYPAHSFNRNLRMGQEAEA